MDEFARIGLVVSLGLAFQAFLDGLLDLGQTLQTILDHLEALVGAVAGGQILAALPVSAPRRGSALRPGNVPPTASPSRFGFGKAARFLGGLAM